MIVSKVKRIEPTLFAKGSDLKFRSFAQTRNFVGDFFESLTAEITRGQRIATDCNADICPDISCGHETYIECKSVGRSGGIIVYKHRAEKDDRFLSEHPGRRLFYFLWRHRCAAGKVESLYQLRHQLAGSIGMLIVLPWSTLRAALLATPEKMLCAKRKTPAGQRCGYGTNGYGVGYSIRYNSILSLANCSTNVRAVSVYGETVDDVLASAPDFETLNWIRQ